MKSQSKFVVLCLMISALGTNAAFAEERSNLGPALLSSTLIGAFNKSAKDSKDPPIVSTIIGLLIIAAARGRSADTVDNQDPVKAIQSNPNFQKLTQMIGADRANKLALDLYAHWSAEKLAEKYGRTEDEKIKIAALLKAPAQIAVSNVPQISSVASKTPVELKTATNGVANTFAAAGGK